MTVSKRPVQPIDEIYDEQQAKHLFEAALRSSRVAARQGIKNAVPDKNRKRPTLAGANANRLVPRR
jgi:hypothetical protein